MRNSEQEELSESKSAIFARRFRVQCATAPSCSEQRIRPILIHQCPVLASIVQIEIHLSGVGVIEPAPTITDLRTPAENSRHEHGGFRVLCRSHSFVCR
jgi:hypothetical protein